MEAKDVLDDKLEALKFTTNENLISLSVIVITLFFHLVFTMGFHIVRG